MSITSGVYPRKSAWSLVLTDGTSATPKSLTIEAFDTVPAIPSPKVIENLTAVNAQGQIIALEEDDDEINFPDYELNVLLMDKNVATSKHAVLEWFNNKKDSDGSTPLVTTNDGAINVIRTSTGAVEEHDVPSAYFMCNLTLTVDNGETGKALTFSYRIAPISAEISADKWGMINLKMKIYSVE